MWLDIRLLFAEHINRTIYKVEKTAGALVGLIKKRLIPTVVHSQILYGALVWHAATNNKKLTQKLTRFQRLVSI